jgi:NADPH:quinone reductase-like Zn-dependent oxidoreductase
MDFEVRRTDLRQHRLVDDPPPTPTDGQVLLHLDHAALTANNITYGAFGDLMGYWGFFPAEDTWGRVPVWGFADVVESRVDGIADGERIYGYFPMSTHLMVEAGRITPTGFTDIAEHRSKLPGVYNQYQRIPDPMSAEAEHIHAVLRPLFTTSFLIDDWLASAELFGAERVIIASASSKTALALAALLSANRSVEVVGLTSERNCGFVAQVGYYDRVVTYGMVSTLDALTPTVLVDMGGDTAVVAEVHHHFGDHLQHSCQVGATHWEQVGFAGVLPGPAPTLFFAPDLVQQRISDWGPSGFAERVDAAWDIFTESATSWMEIVVHRGPAAVTAAFGEVLEGRVPPHQAFVISLDE